MRRAPQKITDPNKDGVRRSVLPKADGKLPMACRASGITGVPKGRKLRQKTGIELLTYFDTRKNTRISLG